jgi:tetratricopeptide (TPR) repeat protein
MPRFDRLEFGGPSDDLAPKQRDVAREVAAAQAAFVDSQLPVDDSGQQSLKRADAERRLGRYENALRQYSRALELDKSLVAGWVGQLQMLVLLDEAPEADVWGRKAIELFPGNGDLLAARAQAVCRVGDLRQAHALIDGAMSAAGKSAYRWLVRGEVLLANRQTVEEHCFAKARQLDADWLVPLEAALIYRHYRVPSKAVMQARLATELAPDQPYAWYLRGSLEAALDQTRLAQKSLEHCLQLSPNHQEAKTLLAELAGGGSILGGVLRRLWPFG